MTPFSSDNPDYVSLTSKYRYGLSRTVNITGENFGTAAGRVKFVSGETGAIIWISQDSRYGKILSWSENAVRVELPRSQAFGRNFPVHSVYKLKVEPADGVRSNPVWLFIRPGGGTTW